MWCVMTLTSLISFWLLHMWCVMTSWLVRKLGYSGNILSAFFSELVHVHITWIIHILNIHSITQLYNYTNTQLHNYTITQIHNYTIIMFRVSVCISVCMFVCCGNNNNNIKLIEFIILIIIIYIKKCIISYGLVS